MEWIFILTFIFGVSDIYGIKVLTCLRLSFSHLNEHISLNVISMIQ